MIKTYSLKNDGEKRLSFNFKAKEFRCKDGSDVIKVDEKLVSILQNIRDWAGAPVTINSAYRTPEHNRKVGGASASQHVKGQACDIVVSGKKPVEVARYAQSIGVNGIIKYDTFVHIDTRGAKYHAINRNGKFERVIRF